MLRKRGSRLTHTESMVDTQHVLEDLYFIYEWVTLKWRIGRLNRFRSEHKTTGDKLLGIRAWVNVAVG